MKLSERFKKSFDFKHLKEIYFPKGKINFKEFGKLFLKLLGVFLIVIALLFIWYAKDLPTPEKLKDWRPTESTHIYDRNGKALYDVSGNINRTVLDAKDIPETVKKATIAAEDKDFYKHHGISITGIIRSFYYNITGKKGYVSGGSTITQQFVKNALLDPQKTYTRKLKELILTIEIEFMYSKDEILVMYLNQIPYGSNAYGVQAAAENYFAKDAKDLTLAESATIAAMAKAPTYYSPYGQHPDKLEERKDYILDRMVTLGSINKEDATKAQEQNLSYQRKQENITAPHFVFYVKEKLVEEYGEQMVNEGGLKVTTTLDLDKQKIAENVVTEGAAKNLKKSGATNASLVSIDPKTGQILSMVGSKDYFDESIDGQVNVAISERQPGSSFKPLVYAAGFKDKYNPGYTLWDVKTEFGNYSPDNYDGSSHGPVSIRTALANSYNIPAVKMLYLVGIDKALETAHEMGITTLNDKSKYGLSLVLGAGEVKLVDMTTAYGVFANKGTLNETTAILKVEDKNGKIIWEANTEKNKKEVLDPQVAYEISSILSDKAARAPMFGNVSFLNIAGHTAAVKTGTTQSYRDAWTIGYTPFVVTGVWVGNNDNTPMDGAAGSIAAAPIWNAYMTKILEGQTNEEFEKPSGIQELTVEKYSNKLPNENSQDFVTDIFSTWQAPQDKDDIHVTVQVCKLCDDDKLAGNNCPDSMRENRLYTNLHSEVPNNPNWENPVLAWARSAGMSIGTPPKQTCDIENERPSINISTPTQNQSVSGQFDITAKASSAFGIKYVEFYMDNNNIGSDNSEPYSISYNANNLSAGNHQIKVKVIDNKDQSAENTVTIVTSGDKTPTATPTNISLTPGTGSITVSWKNPNDADFSSVRIYSSNYSGQIGNVYPTDIAGSPGSTSSHTITGLTSGKKYYFTLHSVDKSGNENQSAVQYSATPN